MALGPEVIKQIRERVVQIARDHRVAAQRRMRLRNRKFADSHWRGLLPKWLSGRRSYRARPGRAEEVDFDARHQDLIYTFAVHRPMITIWPRGNESQKTFYPRLGGTPHLGSSEWPWLRAGKIKFAHLQFDRTVGRRLAGHADRADRFRRTDPFHRASLLLHKNRGQPTQVRMAACRLTAMR